MSTDSNDWLASIDLDAVKSAPRVRTREKESGKLKKRRRRIIYGEPGRLAPVIPAWAQGRGPDQQRAVTEVAGQFVETSELCTAQFTYQEALEVMHIIKSTTSESFLDSDSQPRLLAVLKAAIAPYEFRQAAEEHRLAEAEKAKALNKLLNEAFGLIKLEDE